MTVGALHNIGMYERREPVMALRFWNIASPVLMTSAVTLYKRTYDKYAVSVQLGYHCSGHCVVIRSPVPK